jgi:DNA repair protein RadC
MAVKLNAVKQILPKVAEIKIRYSTKVLPSERAKITSSKDAEAILRPLFEDFIEHREVMYALYLNRANKVLGAYLIGIGGVAGVAADPKLIFQAALKLNASGLILAHNHPSGNTSASQADIELTNRVRQAGKFLDIQLLDHIIMLPNSHFSFADEGII